MNWDDVSKELAKKLNPNVVQPPAQGKYGEYLFAWHVIAEANRIFGFDGWSYSIVLQKVAESVNKKGNTVIGYICKCTLTVDCVTREDVGYGEGVSKNVGDAHKGATKEAATDSLKRALRTFGNPFGLALYDKSKENVADVEPEINNNDISMACGNIWAAKNANHLAEIWTGIESYLDLSKQSKVIAAFVKMKSKFDSEEEQ